MEPLLAGAGEHWDSRKYEGECVELKVNKTRLRARVRTSCSMLKHSAMRVNVENENKANEKPGLLDI